MYYNKVDVQTAINQVAQLCREAHQIFSEAETRLLQATANTPDTTHISSFVQGCKDIALGSINWRYCANGCLSCVCMCLLTPPATKPVATWGLAKSRRMKCRLCFRSGGSFMFG